MRRTCTLVVVFFIWCSASLAGSGNSFSTIYNGHQTIAAIDTVGPRADAGNDLFMILPDNSVILRGTGSSVAELTLTYLWSQVSGPVQLTLDSTSQTIVLTNLTEGSYVLELKVTDENGQTGVDQVKITVSNAGANLQSAIPRFFTPNGDGINDYWEWPHTDLFKKSILMIFDRNGMRVFDDANYANQWDGKFNGKPLPEDVYFYTIRMYQGENILGSVRIMR